MCRVGFASDRLLSIDGISESEVDKNIVWAAETAVFLRSPISFSNGEFSPRSLTRVCIPSPFTRRLRTIGCFVFIAEMVCERRIIIGRYDVSKVKDGRSLGVVGSRESGK